MSLNSTTVLTHFVRYTDFESYVNEIYGVDICYVSMQESSNDSTQIYDVDGQVDENAFTNILNAPYLAFFGAQVILDKLCQDGHIQPGRYAIEVCW